MKSSYELAMERLNKTAPSAKLSKEQKKQLAELDQVYAAKIAEREIYMNDEIAKAVDQQDAKAYEQAQKQLLFQRNSLQAELEEKKEEVRKQG